MSPVLFLLHLITLLLCSTSTNAKNVTLAKPQCTEYCGVVRIPYPFGIEQGCYLDNWFKIQCDKSTGTPTLSAPLSLQVFNISVGGTLQVRSLVTFLNPAICGCPWPNSGRPANLTGSPFVFSQRNKFAVIGCGSSASMTLENGTSVGGCSSACNDGGELPGSAALDSCNGTNCCLADTPPQLAAFNYTYEASNIKASGSEGCKFAFLVDQDSWVYTSAGLSSVGNVMYIPSLLDWNLMVIQARKFMEGQIGLVIRV